VLLRGDSLVVLHQCKNLFVLSCYEKTKDGLLLLYILYFCCNDVSILFASNICFL
jgi:hypothetical protein